MFLEVLKAIEASKVLQMQMNELMERLEFRKNTNGKISHNTIENTLQTSGEDEHTMSFEVVDLGTCSSFMSQIISKTTLQTSGELDLFENSDVKVSCFYNFERSFTLSVKLKICTKLRKPKT